MDDALEKIKTSTAYKLVVMGLALAAANHLAERINLSPKPITQKDVLGVFVSPPGLNATPTLASATLWTTNYTFFFHDGKLFGLMNANTNIEAVEHYREWAVMPSLVDSNGAYQLATNWLARAFVDIDRLNRNYRVGVGQPSFWSNAPTRLCEQGSNLVSLPLYYVSWSDSNGVEAAKAGIFGPTRQMTGITIDDQSLSSHVYLRVTNQKELVDMTNVPWRLIGPSNSIYPRLTPISPPSTNDVQ